MKSVKLKTVLTFFLSLLFVFSFVSIGNTKMATVCCTNPAGMLSCNGNSASDSQVDGTITCDGSSYYCVAWNENGSGC